jgi:hypothetical protein
MADPKIDPKQIALAAAQGVAIALSHRKGEDKGAEFIRPPIIICGLPKILYEAVLTADPDGKVTVQSVTQQHG